MEWQPIETAPKGRVIQHNYAIGGKIVSKESFIREMCLVALNGKVYYTAMLEDGRFNGFSKNDKPTHWMPLPEPPNL